jgi:hypothetical protein
MQQLDSWHLLAALGNLDAVPDQDQPAVDTRRTWEQPQHRLRPQSRKPIELDANLHGKYRLEQMHTRIFRARIFKPQCQAVPNYYVGMSQSLTSLNEVRRTTYALWEGGLSFEKQRPPTK